MVAVAVERGGLDGLKIELCRVLLNRGGRSNASLRCATAVDKTILVVII